MSNNGHNIEKTNFDAFINAVGSEIQQAQVRLITAANAQMLFHYWKMGNYILYYQNLYGWGSKIIKQLAKAIRFNYPEKKGYSERNLTYMCQFARTYPLSVLRSFIDTDVRLSVPNIQNVTNEVLKLNDKQFAQELTAQIQSTDCQPLEFTQEAPAQIQDVEKTVSAIYRMGIREIEKNFLTSPVARINWASQMVILDGSLPLGIGYWYMKQSVEMGWSSNVLKIQIETNLYTRQISNNKVNNFTATLPAPQSDLANYLLKDPYIFDLAGTKEKADERDIEEQLVKHVTRYLLEMGNGFAFVARQKHFQIGNSDFYADLILYSIPLHAYIVVELKATPFKPEYAGQLNFYINVVDDKLRGENDNKTIGLLLCKGKDEVVAQYALTGYDQPIGISDYQLSKAIPENLKSALPSIEEVEEELTSFLDKDKNP
ncbi:putative nuclease YhcG [Bacteroidaceae bacterium]|uniref:PDDEXK nuclease domain-containing protein n=1 Tax=uncultured Phocaeicola sp. TaxID=990718 RepID=UPI0014346CBF|nr:PDDEXK nuclease domain-containing protein [uncultured Phocaeicola sp.]GFH98807.1 putative nuclease YhcG [Bacteroidaceae bacterium]